MTETVKNTRKNASSVKNDQKLQKVATTDDNKYAAEMASKHGRPCESSAVFEAWAQHQ